MEFSPIQQARALQTTSATGDMCAVTEAFADDDDILRQHSTTFQPTCTCLPDDPLDVNGYFKFNPFPEDADRQEIWVYEFNAFHSNIESDDQVGCVNKCSVCVSEESPCLFLEEQQRTMLHISLNMSLDEWWAWADLSDEAATAFLLEQITIFSENTTFTLCYMPEGSSTGKVCFTVTAEFSPEEGIAFPEYEDNRVLGCSVSVDGTDCASCSAVLPADCVIADCSNIAGGASDPLISCSKERSSFPGVFGPAYDILSSEKVTYKLGSCPGDGTRGTTLTTHPTSSPVSVVPSKDNNSSVNVTTIIGVVVVVVVVAAIGLAVCFRYICCQQQKQQRRADDHDSRRNKAATAATQQPGLGGDAPVEQRNVMVPSQRVPDDVPIVESLSGSVSTGQLTYKDQSRSHQLENIPVANAVPIDP